MIDDQKLQQLGERARREPVPSVDVSGAVMARIAAPRDAANGQALLGALRWVAAAAVAVSLLMVLYALPALTATADPVAEIMLIALGA